jgi:hypothetical protein
VKLIKSQHPILCVPNPVQAKIASIQGIEWNININMTLYKYVGQRDISGKGRKK